MENPQPMGGNGKRPAYGHGETKREWRVTFTIPENLPCRISAWDRSGVGSVNPAWDPKALVVYVIYSKLAIHSKYAIYIICIIQNITAIYSICAICGVRLYTAYVGYTRYTW
jgi:hypothetical protein